MTTPVAGGRSSGDDLDLDAFGPGSADHVGSASAAGEGKNEIGSVVEHGLIPHRSGSTTVLLPLSGQCDCGETGWRGPRSSGAVRSPGAAVDDDEASRGETDRSEVELAMDSPLVGVVTTPAHQHRGLVLTPPGRVLAREMGPAPIAGRVRARRQEAMVGPGPEARVRSGHDAGVPGAQSGQIPEVSQSRSPGGRRRNAVLADTSPFFHRFQVRRFPVIALVAAHRKQ